MSNTYALSNHKGGVGKTTSTLNIGAGLAKLGKKVLLIDLDPQANLSQCSQTENADFHIYGALKGDYELKPIQVKKNLDIIPSVLDLAGAEVELASKIARETILQKLIEPLKPNYEYILIDCPPSLGLLTINAFAASDAILIPLQAHFLALHGFDKLLDVVKLVQENLNPNLKIKGVFTTQYNKRRILNREIDESIREYFDGQVFETKIRENISLAEAPSQGKDIFEYSPRSYGATDYQALVKELIMNN